jgi:hypothetical protein
MYHITKQETYNTGGGCMVDILHLPNGKVLILSDEYAGLYNRVEDMLDDDGTKCLNGFWLNDPRQFVATWGAGYATQETRNLTMSEITEDNGYFEWGIEKVEALQVGQTADLSDMSGDLTITRVK